MDSYGVECGSSWTIFRDSADERVLTQTFPRRSIAQSGQDPKPACRLDAGNLLRPVRRTALSRRALRYKLVTTQEPTRFGQVCCRRRSRICWCTHSRTALRTGFLDSFISIGYAHLRS